MAKPNMRIPSTQGGLIRYFDEEYKSKVLLKPQVVIGIVAGIGALIICLHAFL